MEKAALSHIPGVGITARGKGHGSSWGVTGQGHIVQLLHNRFTNEVLPRAFVSEAQAETLKPHPYSPTTKFQFGAKEGGDISGKSR